METVQSVLCKRDRCAEIIVVDDGSSPPAILGKVTGSHIKLIRTGGIGPARARNHGARIATSEFLLFIDAHVHVPEGWLSAFLDTFTRYPRIAALSPGIRDEGGRRTGYGMTWNRNGDFEWLRKPRERVREVPMLPAGCLAIRREVFRDCLGFNEAFRGYGYEDQEISLKLWLLGYRLVCQSDVHVIHRFRSRFPYLVVDWDMYYNRLRMVVTHLSERRIARTLFTLQREVDPTYILARLFTDNTAEDRRYFLERRKRSDDWFVKRFRIPF